MLVYFVLAEIYFVIGEFPFVAVFIDFGVASHPERSCGDGHHFPAVGQAIRRAALASLARKPYGALPAGTVELQASPVPTFLALAIRDTRGKRLWVRGWTHRGSRHVLLGLRAKFVLGGLRLFLWIRLRQWWTDKFLFGIVSAGWSLGILACTVPQDQCEPGETQAADGRA